MRLAIASFFALSLSVAFARPAHAGCGFYAAPESKAAGAALINDADQVVLMREGTRFALTMSTNYKGPLEDFAMVVPVPVVLHKENVKTLSPAIFTHLEKLTAPRVVEYDERDPCEEEREGVQGVGAAPGGAPNAKGGGGGGLGGYGVKVEASFIQGEYEIVVLSAEESDGLERWLKDNKYAIPAGASKALAPYVAAQQKFVIAKIDAKKVLRDAQGAVVLSPLRFVYETNDFRLPVRLGLLNAPKGGKQDLIIYLLGRDKRMESANYQNVAIPTNVDVDESALTKLGPFYAALFDATLKKAGGRAVVTEYAWDAFGCGAPCTTTPLAIEEIRALGADDLLGKETAAPGVVLTRLHTRYDAETLSEDIVFRAAEGIAGGTEGAPGAESEKPTTIGAGNAFQARYTIRHAWKSAIDCASPKRGRWVARPHGGDSSALGLAAAARDVTLASMVKSPILALDLGKEARPFAASPPAKPKAPEVKPEARDPWTFVVGAGAAVVVIGLAFVMLSRKRSAS
jgi:hypothetical protein